MITKQIYLRSDQMQFLRTLAYQTEDSQNEITLQMIEKFLFFLNNNDIDAEKFKKQINRKTKRKFGNKKMKRRNVRFNEDLEAKTNEILNQYGITISVFIRVVIDFFKKLEDNKNGN